MTDADSGKTPRAALADEADERQRGRPFALLLGIAGFTLFALLPGLPDAIDPSGETIVVTREAKLALGLFVLAAVWWVTEAVPVGITAITIAVVQALFQIRDARAAFTDFLDPAVWFIIGAFTIGMAFSSTGLTKRLTYRMLALAGERTSMIYLGTFLMTAGLTLFMAHTAVAAALFPLLTAIHALYGHDGVTRFGKGLFIGMAFTAGAGSIITLFGAARAAVAIGFFRDLAGREISFGELTYYMLPLGVTMVFLLWLYILVVFRPDKPVIFGLRRRARELHKRLGPVSWQEWLVIIVTLIAIAAMSLRSVIPLLGQIDKSAIILAVTVVFFVFRILDLDDLESLPLNIIFLFGGAMSIGFCLWQTGAARWLAIQWLTHLPTSPLLVFVIGLSLFVLLLTNLIMNVAAIAISLPVALAVSGYLGIAPELVLYSTLAVAGMPFLFMVGAAPNAIAYQSRQFSSAEFFRAGIPASILLLAVLALFVWKIWPWMGMPVHLAG
ncbi:MAG: SLC13 family permease [Gammaproteobacteria bacterium]|nr:SLC13 family permease [Gammaproteobacteria bacterium]NNF61799.1 SLC13/DASS family transporter [Gammaproteobacteria bacterium]NNM19723.1 SLC13/DASS family transporter [Gammaproteobacteria bacterium]